MSSPGEPVGTAQGLGDIVMNDFAPVDIRSSSVRGTGVRPAGAARGGTTQQSVAKAGIVRGSDRVDLSQEAVASAESSTKGNEIRSDFVQRVRGEIASGGYVTPEKVNHAVDEVERDLSTEFVKRTSS